MYFVTTCTQNSLDFFGKIHNDKMILNDAGEMVGNIWCSLLKRHHVELDTFQIMPNHVHLIIQIVNKPVGAGFMTACSGFMPTRLNKRRETMIRATTKVTPTLGDSILIVTSWARKQK